MRPRNAIKRKYVRGKFSRFVSLFFLLVVCLFVCSSVDCRTRDFSSFSLFIMFDMRIKLLIVSIRQRHGSSGTCDIRLFMSSRRRLRLPEKERERRRVSSFYYFFIKINNKRDGQ